MTKNVNSTQPTSYWATSFVHASNDHDYFVLSHILDNYPGVLYRTSLLDITNTSLYTSYQNLYNTTSAFSAATGIFATSTEDFVFGVISEDDSLGPITISSTVAGAIYDITFEQSAPALLNGGLGVFATDFSPSVHAWSMPAGTTTGTLTID